MTQYIKYIFFVLVLAAATGCQDELFMDPYIGEGEAKVQVTMDFQPMSSALSRSDGKALSDINSLHVLLYDKEQNLIKKWEIAKTDLDIKYPDRTDADAENNKTAETKTAQATFDLPDEIDFGTYYMYAVANIPDLFTNNAYTEHLKTVEGLKNIPLEWNSGDITKNGQMLGFFTNSSEPIKSGNEQLVIKEKSVNLHSWLRRAASKVTVSFDGTKLKEGVFIYIQSVQIKDIPSQCYLGKDNNVGGEGYTLETPASGPAMDDGEIITYHNDFHKFDPNNYNKNAKFDVSDDCAAHRVTSGKPILGNHNEDSPYSLYFFENLQGAGENMPDKRQDHDNDNVLDHPGLPDADTYRLKDDVPYGSYIEVHAHYISTNAERIGNGHIIYRFMLGQDVIKDYNAKRNCHYKLTLQFKNFANEADWHIEYEEPEPGVMTPVPYYISYLYKHSLEFPIKVSPGIYEIESIHAEIKENSWIPQGAGSDVYLQTAPVNNCDGFLSLHETTETVLYESYNGTKYTNAKYYDGGILPDNPSRWKRDFKDFNLEGATSKIFTQNGAKASDTYRVEKTDEDTYTVYIPMWTREKQMISTTGFTGNNPYVAYQRRAVVEITTKLKDSSGKTVHTFTNTVPVIQVRRIVNPKGIYRDLGTKNNTFHVVLKRLPRENGVNFVTFPSEGPWRAYITRRTNGDGITLEVSESGKSTTEKRAYSDSQTGTAIFGKTGSDIDFNVKFSPTVSGATQNRYAIIRVDYHNFTCEHLIFVRQGDNPDNLDKNGTGVKWYAMNMRTKDELASTPLDEGSLFQFKQWDMPIDAVSNKNPKTESKPYWINVEASDFKAPAANSLKNAATKVMMSWGDIKGPGSIGTDDVFGNPTLSKARVATAADFWELRQPGMEQGYGILYGDDATQTADDIDEAYGYDYENNKTGRGMRGCFAYNSETGKSLFFPIGASGYGHRKQSYTPSWGDTESADGVLRYSSGRTNYYKGATERPLFYDIFRRPGAIYWLNQQIDKNLLTPTDGPSLGWDINYFSFDFNFISTGNMIRGGGSDACFVRCVVP